MVKAQFSATLGELKTYTKSSYLTKFVVAVINKLIPQLEVDWININY